MKQPVFFITIEIVRRNEDKKAFEQYKHAVNIYREKFTGTFEDAQKKVNDTINSTPGYLRRAEIESLRDGLCGLYFVREYSWK